MTHVLEPRLTATSVIQSPCYYGHLFPARQNGHTFSYKKKKINAVSRKYGQRPFLKSQIVDSYNFTPLSTSTHVDFIHVVSGACSRIVFRL